MSELVSIIINCHNGEKFLQRCLQSVINQNYKNWEIIFWNNNSTDNSKKIFQSYNDERFNLL
jgi:Glycosyltransferases involved in cell wall biogenesis